MADESKSSGGPSKVVVDHSKVFTLKGSCHCGNVSFTIQSKTPYPYSACRRPRRAVCAVLCVVCDAWPPREGPFRGMNRIPYTCG